MTHTYRLPRANADRLHTALRGRRNAADAETLAIFLARHWSVPGRLLASLWADRRGLASIPALGLSEWRVRCALALLEEIGFLEREPVTGSSYQRTPGGPMRKPTRYRFGRDYLEAFIRANTKARRPIPRPAAPRQPSSHKQPLPRGSMIMGELPIRPLDGLKLSDAARHSLSSCRGFGTMLHTDPVYSPMAVNPTASAARGEAKRRLRQR